MARGIAKSGGRTYAGSYDSNVYCIEGGKELWNVPMSSSVLDICISKRVYACSGFGELFCISLDGKVEWSKMYDTPLWSCACTNDRVAVGGANGLVASLDLAGNEMWRAKFNGSIERLTFHRESLAMSSPHEDALRILDGKGLITYEEALGQPLYALAFLEDGSLVCSSGNTLFKLAPDRSLAWGFDVGAPVRAVAVGKDLYCASLKTLFCISRDGKLKWHRMEPAHILGVACDDANVATASNDGLVRDYPIEQAVVAPQV